MRTGTVKWFHRNKGYGFISSSDNKEDVFVFYPSIVCDGFKTLRPGQSVLFEAIKSALGSKAIRVIVN